MMEVEMDEHLSYGRSERSDSDDYHNGYKPKRINSCFGSVDIQVPQDRKSTFEPQVVRKRQKDISGIDQKIISMYGKGITTSQISDTLMEIYGFEDSEGFISDVPDNYRKCPEGWRVKFKMKSNSIKIYDKFSCLRVEMTVNAPKGFKDYKDVHHRGGTISKRWAPMGKSISNLYRYDEISKAANSRFLDSLCNIIPAQSIEKEIDGICGKKVVRNRVYTGYNVWSQ